LSDQLYGTPGRYQHLRKETVQFMRANKADFEPFHSDGPFDRHLDLLAEDATYAGTRIKTQQSSKKKLTFNGFFF
jgi:hypothetical protein